MPLDRESLRTPRHHGDFLLEPPATHWRTELLENQRVFEGATVPIGGQALAICRDETRKALVGCSNRPIIVLGHQPEFFHPGVWAKHVLANRFATAVGGVAINLIVDNDILKTSVISVPQMTGGRWLTQSIRMTSAQATTPFESLPALSSNDIKRLEREFSSALGPAFQTSALPVFFEGLGSAPTPGDWVNQFVAGRRAVEQAFGIELLEHRISALAFTPLLLETLRESRRFAAAYNEALDKYRTENGIRDPRRPMPDLQIADNLCELPWWALRSGFPRRRLFCAEHGDRLSLLAEDSVVLELSKPDLTSAESLNAALARQVTWAMRPRAITLTLWARLLLADFFIHGIGGAKYDAVCDVIIERYFNLPPPHFAAVSATLRWDPASEKESEVDAADHCLQTLRDARYNPQRHFPTNNSAPNLIVERRAAIETAENLARTNPKDRPARRSAFRRIRAANAAILEHHATLWHALELRYAAAAQELQQRKIALGREYFFAAYPIAELEKLVTALSAAADFAV